MDLAIDQTGIGNRWSLEAGLAGWGLAPVTDVAESAELLRVRRSGQIVTQAGRLQAIYGRWWPYAGNLLQAKWDSLLRPVASDRCELFYHQASAEGGFLTLAYVRSGKSTSLSTCYAAALVLDEIAKLKQSSAMLCHVTNARISQRLLERWGWQAHCLHWQGRHYIKRLYGNYPNIAPQWRERLTLDRNVRSVELVPSARSGNSAND